MSHAGADGPTLPGGVAPAGRFAVTRRALVVIAAGFVVTYHALVALAGEANSTTGFAAWFPAAGVMFVALFATDWRWVPLVYVTRLTAVLWWDPRDLGVERAALEAVCVVAAYWAGARLLRHLGVRRAHVADFGRFFAVAVVATPLLAAVSASFVESSVDDVRFADVFDDSRTFWVGDALGVATVVPLFLVVVRTIVVGRPRTALTVGRWRRAETVVQIAVLVAAPLLATSLLADYDDAIAFGLVIVPLVWVALRNDLLEAAIGIFVLVAIASTTLRERLPDDDLLRFQYLLLCSTMVALFAAAVRRTNDDLTASVIDEHHRYELIEHTELVIISELLPDGSPSTGAHGLDGDPRPVDLGLAGCWERFGPAVVGEGSTVAFDWRATVDGRARSFSSVAMPFRRADGALERVLVVTSDRTELDRAEALAKAAVQLDAATGLPNRRHFLDLVDTWRRRERRQPAVAVVAFDSLLDLHGRPDEDTEAGALVADIARLVSAAVPDAIAVGRLDQFAIGVAVDGDAVDDESLRTLGELMMASVRPATVGGAAGVGTAVSIGLDDSGSTARELVEHADRAARRSASLGADRVTVFHPSLIQRADPIPSTHELRRACDDGELVPYFQPIVDLATGDVVGAEALARWLHPEHGIRSPSDFIPVAEASGLIARIDELMLTQSIAWMDERAAAGRLPDGFAVSVNLSAVHLHDLRLIENLMGLSGRVDASRIRFEITESQAMVEPEHSLVVLSELAALGFGIHLDDFGTGYSSMAWLHRLPVRGLKIDRSFIAALPGSDDSMRIVRTIAGLATELGITVTAEGIETRAQCDAVLAAGCQLGQGRWFGPPVAGSEFP